MKTGISTACLYPMLSEKSLETLLGAGYRHFEFFINAMAETEKSFLKNFKSQADAAGGSFVSVHPFTAAMESMYFFGEYDRREAEGTDIYRKFFSAAAYIGADKLVLHGQHMSRRGGFTLEEKEYFERYHALRKIGLEYGVKLCQENVQGFRSSQPDFIRNMHDYLGNECNFVFDIKQTLLAGVDKFEMLKAMGTGLSHVHLSDNSADNMCLLPGEGNFDMKDFRKRLEELNYGGSIITEVYKNGVKGTESLEKARIFAENAFGGE